MRYMLEQRLSRAIFEDVRVSHTARSVYLGLRAHKRTYKVELARMLNIPYATLHRAVELLRKLDWVYVYRDSQLQRVIVVPWMPYDLETVNGGLVKKFVETAPHKGEALLKILLDIIVNETEYLDNHRYRWSVSSDSSHRFEVDRMFPLLRVAIEFQGRQHYETVTFADGRSNLQRQQALDRRKAIACERRGITLIEIADVELSYETVVAKLTGVLPLIQPLPNRPLFRTLVDMMEEHAGWARQNRGRA